MRNPPILTARKPGEKLFMYLGVSSIATSVVLIRCEKGKQFPVFYVSKTMSKPERRNSKAERVILSLVNVKRKLMHYFESHPIVVLTIFPIRVILHKPDLSGRMTNWAIELSSFDITYEPRRAIKGQAVADFLLECDVADPEENPGESSWKLFVDGFSNQMGVKSLVAFSDSQLIVQQVTGEYIAKDETMEVYRSAIMREARNFDQIKFIQLPREYNEDADRLACSVSSSGETLARVISVGVLCQLSIFEEPSSSDPWQVNVIPYEPSWINPILTYIQDGVLPEQRDEVRKFRSNAAKYAIIHNQLYMRSYLGPYLKYVSPTEARQILRTIHEGVCEEKKDAAAVRLAAYQQMLMNSHNKKVRYRDFAPGDLVLKKKVGILKKMMSPW
ncbi:uncharacterized protein LOC132305119 [Cornus florida]|uniref:uncharacterized protein LOC132305119 n=1 Tax=Cornus florida TaxID=4283 RepID=UPI00289842F8|nr:uncharacterized protein LOC132305119 [Cornus florida]